MRFLARLAFLSSLALCAVLTSIPRAQAVLPGSWTYADVTGFSYYPAYQLGGAFEGLPETTVDHVGWYYGAADIAFPQFAGPVDTEDLGATQAFSSYEEPPTEFVDFTYGDCEPPPVTADYQAAPTCPFPLEVQTWPVCLRNPSLYAQPIPAESLIVRGVPALSFNEGTRLEVFTGNVDVVIFGTDPGQVRRAADAISVANGTALSTNPDYVWMQPFVQFNRLPPPLAGSITGQAPCHPISSFPVPQP